MTAAARWSASRVAITLLLCTAGWAIAAILCLCVGSTGSIGWPTESQLPFRRDMVLIASLIGAALAASGVAYQAVLRNPLADPYLLGVSSGASLAAYLWRFPSVYAIIQILPASVAAASQQLFVFVGALLSVAIVFLLATRRGRLEPVTLLLVGVVINSVNGAIFMLLNFVFKDVSASGGAISFLVGAIQTTILDEQLYAATIVCAIGFAILMVLSGQLNAAGLGTGEAKSLGIRIHRLRWIVLIVASLTTASAVAISGPIGFVGLICPHLARLIVGSDHRRLLPVATAIGAALLAIADAASRRLAQGDAAGTWLPVGVLTGLLGGPFFLLILSRRRKGAID
ncbi:MAG TPA: iron ABC transporter permease [Tepidisphaeraceae bacterium]|jgi:iron complex transport system permease protein|nr:iron ABC transporter permease [Tepidisphaeraceae bacterium]